MPQVSITVNGAEHTLELEPRELLVYVLRERLGLTGTNVGFRRCLKTLDAEVVIRGPEGVPTVPIGEFVTSVFDTVLGPTQDVLTEIRVPKLGPAGWSYLKFTRRAQDWATVGVTAIVRSNGSVDGSAIVFTNMGPKPIRAKAAEQALTTPDDIDAAAEASLEGTDPPSDTQGSAEYRRHLAKVLVQRALQEAMSRCVTRLVRFDSIRRLVVFVP